MILYKFRYIAFYSLLVLLFVPSLTFAQTSANSFSINQQIGLDNVPPTTPSSISVTPITSSQINVTWGAATDDVYLAGYRLFRDLVQIATTSLTTYSDTGLTASTSYSYTVEAYDWYFNISTSSVAAATTTLPLSEVLPQEGSSGTLLQVRLTDLTIDTNQTEVTIAWATNIYARYVLRWGKVSEYDLGFVQNETFKKSHQTAISDLEPGTRYVYELIAYNQQGTEFSLSEGSFTTEAPADVIAPANVANLTAIQQGDSVELSWQNPDDLDFYKIRIVRNYNFYPGDPTNGYITYEGTNESFFDRDALLVYGNQYYTVFAYDETGNISSGAVILVQKNGGTPSSSVQDMVTPEDPLNASSSQTASIPIDVDFFDVWVLQNDIRINPVGDHIPVIQNYPITFKIPYELLPEHLKTIVVTIQSDNTQPVSYMLRVNKDKSAYEAVIPPLLYSGDYTLTFSVYDYQTELLTTFDGMLRAEQVFLVSQFTKQSFQPQFLARSIFFILLFLILIMLLGSYFILLKRRSDEDKKLGTR